MQPEQQEAARLGGGVLHCAGLIRLDGCWCGAQGEPLLVNGSGSIVSSAAWLSQ